MDAKKTGKLCMEIVYDSTVYYTWYIWYFFHSSIIT